MERHPRGFFRVVKLRIKEQSTNDVFVSFQHINVSGPMDNCRASIQLAMLGDPCLAFREKTIRTARTSGFVLPEDDVFLR